MLTKTKQPKRQQISTTEKIILLKEYFISASGWQSPTHLGKVLFGKYYSQASAYVNKPLKELVKIGFLEKNKRGKHRLSKDY